MAMLRSRRKFRAYVAWQLVQLLLSVPLYGFAASSAGALGVAIASAAMWFTFSVAGCIIAVSPHRISVSDLLGVFLLPWATAIPPAVLLFFTLDGLSAEGPMLRITAMCIGIAAALALAFATGKWINPAAWNDLAPLRRLAAALIGRVLTIRRA
jgi:hypothetical protein